MTSIYQQALGPAFERLHPQIQRRFGFCSEDGTASIGRGVMETLWHGRFYTLPFLYLGAWRRIMFPEQGENVPFTIENYAYLDGFGRETVSWIRTFHARRVRRFDAYMIYSPKRGVVVDYLGSHQHLAVDLEMEVDERGGLRVRSREQRFYKGPVGFRFPRFFTGDAEVNEWYDDSTQKFRIEVRVVNRFWGPLFGYRGSFEVEWKTIKPDEVPRSIFPRREERRE